MSRHGKVRVKIDKALIQRQVQSGGKRGTFAMLDHIASVSKDQVPLDMGPLKNSCVVDVAEDGKSFTFKPKAKQKHFERQYHAFLDKACELTGISLDAFVGEAKYDIGMAMYKLNEHYQDKFSLYVYFNDELKSLDEWIRETDLSGSFYFGGTLDYHY